MLNTSQRVNQLITYLYKNLSNKGFSCPSCGNKNSKEISRKYLVTALKRCGNCNLMYRAPTSTESEFEKFYQSAYTEGFTTDMPSDTELSRLLSNNFSGTDRDYTGYISILKALGGYGATVIDYGCSWGYGSYQIKKAGFTVTGFEISKPRCDFAKNKLRIDAYSDISEIKEPADIFFSSHVLEHIANVNSVIELAKKLVKTNGYFVAITPNGSNSYRKADPDSWQSCWGFVHPLHLDDIYYKSNFKDYPMLLDSSPFDCSSINNWIQKNNQPTMNILNLSGGELLLIAKL